MNDDDQVAAAIPEASLPAEANPFPPTRRKVPAREPPPPRLDPVEPVAVIEGWLFLPALRIIESPSGETILHAARVPSPTEFEGLLRAHLVGLLDAQAVPCEEVEQAKRDTVEALAILRAARERLSVS